MNLSAPTTRSLNDAGRLSWPAELIALGFHLIMIWSVVAAMQRIASDDRFSVLGPLATAGLFFGFFLARSRVQDLFAHSLAVWAGAVVSFVLVSLHIGDPSEVISTRAQVLRDLVSGVASSLSRIDNEPVANEQRLVVLGITSWLLAYSSAWVVYRRRWFTAGIGVPAAILLASIRVDDRNGGWELILFIAGAIGLAARDSFSAFLQRWIRRGLDAPRSAATWFMASAVPIALATVLLASAIKPAISQIDSASYGEKVDNLLNSAATRWNDLLNNGENAPSGYQDFPDEWDTDGVLDLGEDVIARVDSAQAYYLAARRYDEYTGRGWRTNVGETFSGSRNTDEPIINVTYTAGNSVTLSANVSQDRSEETVAITLVRPTGDLVLTTGVFTGADLNVQTIMGWIQVPSTAFDVENGPIEDLPPDFQRLISEIRGEAFQIDRDSGEVVFTNPDVAGEVAGQIEHLSQFPVTVVFTEGENGQLVASFSGRVPNYDDIEAVYFQDDVDPDDSYQTSGSMSIASDDELSSAGEDYPEWVTDRYLSLPDTVTERTRSRAAEIAALAAAQDPYSVARAIEAWFQSDEFEYLENPPALPEGEDLVDYFLFEQQMGRCQQFATAMAVMLRAENIPARVVLGYNASSQQDESGEWIYREKQAHSWVEVFFPGYGWVPFEPTKGFGFTGDLGPESDSVLDASPTPVDSPTVESTPEIQSSPMVEPSPVPPTLSKADSDDGNLKSLILVLFGIGLALIAGILGYMVVAWNRGLGGLRPASGYFARLIKLGAWFGLEPTASTTPGEFARSFSRTVPGTESAVRSITEAYYIEKFNPAVHDQESLASAEAGWKQLRRNLLRWRIRTPK